MSFKTEEGYETYPCKGCAVCAVDEKGNCYIGNINHDMPDAVSLKIVPTPDRSYMMEFYRKDGTFIRAVHARVDVWAEAERSMMGWLCAGMLFIVAMLALCAMFGGGRSE